MRSLRNFAALIPLLGLFSALDAHEHHNDDGSKMSYHLHCCHDKDCAPVSNMEPDTNGTWMTTRHGRVYVEYNGRWDKHISTDGKFHVCMLPTIDGRMRVVCVYFPEQY